MVDARGWATASTTLLSLKSLCGGGVPSSHPSLGLSVFFLSAREKGGDCHCAISGLLFCEDNPCVVAACRSPIPPLGCLFYFFLSGVRYPLAEPAEVAGSSLLIHLVHLQIVWRLNLLRGERQPVVQPARVHPMGPRMSTFDVLAHMRFRVPIRFRFVSSSPSLTKFLPSPFYIHKERSVGMRR